VSGNNRLTSLSSPTISSRDTGDGQPPRFLTTWNPAVHYARLFERNLATPLGIAHRRSVLDRAGGFQPALPGVEEDWDLLKRFAAAGAVFLFLPFTAGTYHVRQRSRSHASVPP
jgi:hypothetical protein